MTVTLREAPRAAERTAREGQVNILLVDDRAENLLALEAILEPLGEHLVRAYSGDDALKCLLTDEFAVILLDVQMPGLNGFETAEMIKSRERTRFVPIIFLTAISKDEEYVFRGYSVGAVDYMSKPFQPDVLRSKVAVFVDLYRKQAQLKHQERLLRDAAVREVELEHRARLLAQEARTAEIVRTAMDAIIVLDAERRIRLFNAEAERMFGQPRGSAIGRLVVDLFPDGELDRALTMVENTPRANQAGNELHSLRGMRAIGERFPLEATVVLSRGRGRAQLSHHRARRDRTDRERGGASHAGGSRSRRTRPKLRALEKELHARREELERRINGRKPFLPSMNPNLRTPIRPFGVKTLFPKKF